MRLFPAFAAAAFLATTPCMAQVVIGGGDNDATRHEYRADRQEQAAHRDAYVAHKMAEHGNYQGAAREQAESRQHQAVARDQERRADWDSRVHDSDR
jgi:hypothetical protein